MKREQRFECINDGLVAWYPMEGDAQDASGHGADGSNHTDLVRYAPGKHGLAAWFDGHSSIRLPQPRLLEGASNATISAWIFFSTAAGGQIIAAGDERDGLDPISTRINPGAAEDLRLAQVTDGSQIDLSLGRAALPGLTIGEWRLFTLVMERTPSRSLFRCYLDARLVAQTSSMEFAHIAYDTDMPPLVGAIEVSHPRQYWNGAIDELRIYDRALSHGEIAELFGEVMLLIEVSEVRLCWYAATNKTFQLQYLSELTSNRWTDLGPPVPGSGTMSCATQAVVSPQRFYRVLVLP